MDKQNMGSSPIDNSEQTCFWEGSFGDDYTERNQINSETRLGFFRRVLSRTFGVSTICELGANKGHNLQALHKLSRNFRLSGIEINKKACADLAGLPYVHALNASIQTFAADEPFDMVFVCGVLIHLNPDDLPLAYRKMFDLSRRYVLINEYFNPSPVELPYRGNGGKLFKRDFGGEFMDSCGKEATLVDYGFLWKRLEPAWDNTTWWLFEKSDPTGKER